MTHQDKQHCVACGDGEPRGAGCGYEELCLDCQEGKCIYCGCENDTDGDYCSECEDKWAQYQHEAHLDWLKENR